jgi:hypothetical protein
VPWRAVSDSSSGDNHHRRPICRTSTLFDSYRCQDSPRSLLTPRPNQKSLSSSGCPSSTSPSASGPHLLVHPSHHPMAAHNRPSSPPSPSRRARDTAKSASVHLACRRVMGQAGSWLLRRPVCGTKCGLLKRRRAKKMRCLESGREGVFGAQRGESIGE